MAPGCAERLDWEFLRYVWRFNRLERPKVVAALGQHGQHLDPVVFRRDGEVTQLPARLSLIVWRHVRSHCPCPRSAPPATCRSRRARCSSWWPTWSAIPSSCRCARRWSCARAAQEGETQVLVADMSVGYGAIRETFTSQVTLDPVGLTVRAQGTEDSPRAVQQARQPLGVPPEFERRLRGRLRNRLRLQVDDAADAGRRPVRARVSSLHARLRGARAGDLRRRAERGAGRPAEARPRTLASRTGAAADVAEAALAMQHCAAAPRRRDVDEADGLGGAAAARAGDAGDGDGDVERGNAQAHPAPWRGQPARSLRRARRASPRARRAAPSSLRWSR